MSLRVSNDEANELVSMAVDTVTDYVQGSVKSFTYAKDQNDITLTNLSTGKSTTYDISSKQPSASMARTSHSRSWSGTPSPPFSSPAGMW